MMQKRVGIEGSPASKMVQLIRKHGGRKYMSIESATVVSPYPALSIQLEEDDIILEQEDLIITQQAADRSLIAGDRVVVIGDDDTQLYFVIDKVVN